MEFDDFLARRTGAAFGIDGDLAAETMRGRMPVVSEGKALKPDRDGLGVLGLDVVQKNPARSTTAVMAAPGNRGLR